MKTMNPGCNCCGRVLIWDVTIGQYTSWVSTEEWLNDLGAEVDFAIGAPTPTQSTVANDPNYDPNIDGVDLGYWSGNINDYSLVIWHLPNPNNLGGIPVWWDAVSIGSWSGRLVMTHRAVFTVTLPQVLATTFADFINTLSDRTGLQLNTSTRSRMGERLDDCTRIEVDRLGGPFPESTTCTWINIPYAATPQNASTIGHTASDVLEGVGDVYNGSVEWNPTFIVDIDRVDFNMEPAALAAGTASPLQSLFQVATHVSDRETQLETTLENLEANVCPADPGATRRAVHYDLPPTEEATLTSAARRTVQKETGRLVEFVLTHHSYLRRWPPITSTQAGFIFFADGCDGASGTFDPIEEIDLDPGPEPFEASHRALVGNLFQKGLRPISL